MEIIKNENNIMVDVDGTLIDHIARGDSHELTTLVTDPVNPGRSIRVRVNHNMVRLVKEEAARGSNIIVWSRGGYAWAANVVTALGLQKYVTQVMTKPLVYFDDLEVEEWLKVRVYLDPKTPYKQQTKGV